MAAPRLWRRLIRADGAVVIPARLADAVLVVLTLGLDVLSRRNELGRLSPQMHEILEALQAASSRAPDPGMSANGPTRPGPASLESPDLQGTKELLTVAAAAEILGSSTRHLRRLCSTGRLPAKRLGRAYFISPGDLDDYRFGRKDAA